jgi:hypothetical protein
MERRADTLVATGAVLCVVAAFCPLYVKSIMQQK